MADIVGAAVRPIATQGRSYRDRVIRWGYIPHPFHCYPSIPMGLSATATPEPRRLGAPMAAT